MSEGRVTLELDKYECGVIFHSLKDKRNQMLKEERPTEKDGGAAGETTKGAQTP